MEPERLAASISRRQFVRKTALAGAALATAVPNAWAAIEQPFQHGVASGDPRSDRVIIWTRVTPGADRHGQIAAADAAAHGNPGALLRAAELRLIPVLWQVALDEEFRHVVRRGPAFARAEGDYTVKVDVTGLQPGTRYYYRFMSQGEFSRVGRTKTLPIGAAAQVKLAVFSCSNYPAGFFNSYAAAARIADLDAFVHLGDYIYEYARNGYASGNAAQLGRSSEPDAELIALDQYRRRHAQYKSDPDSQALHAAVPLIAVWDDHESANDAWRDGAENHSPAAEGSWAARKAAALRAYYEWLPIRPVDATRPEVIYRSFDFGTLVSLHMLDTRLAGRERQLDYRNYFATGTFDGARFAAEVADPARQLLGAPQTTWLQDRLAQSNATWQVLGQQVLMGRMNVPAPLVFQQVTVSQYAALVGKLQAGAPLTPQEQAILAAPSIPYNLDAWDGYAAAREAVLGTARQLGKNLVVLAGDTHNAWANDLLDLAGNPVGVEFAGTSVSSPGFEAIFPDEDPAVFARSLEALIGPLAWCDVSRRGFLLVTATPNECRADWRFVSTVLSRNYTISTGRALRTLPGAGNRRIVEV